MKSIKYFLKHLVHVPAIFLRHPVCDMFFIQHAVTTMEYEEMHILPFESFPMIYHLIQNSNTLIYIRDRNTLGSKPFWIYWH